MHKLVSYTCVIYSRHSACANENTDVYKNRSVTEMTKTESNFTKVNKKENMIIYYKMKYKKEAKKSV